MVQKAGNQRSSRDVNIQDQHTEIIDVHLNRKLDDLTLLTALVIDDTSADIETTGITPVIGDKL